MILLVLVGMVTSVKAITEYRFIPVTAYDLSKDDDDDNDNNDNNDNIDYFNLG